MRRHARGALLRILRQAATCVTRGLLHIFWLAAEAESRYGGAGARFLQAQPPVASKCGLPVDASGEERKVLRADSIRKEAEASLRRLGISVIAVSQLILEPRTHHQAL